MPDSHRKQPPSTQRAAGGVLWRLDHDGDAEVALVHRPRYDDWSLPKGKLHSGEVPLAAAAREVGEETGSAVGVSRYLGRTAYPVAAGRKTVDYWAMRHRGGTFTASPEVDELRWLPVAAAPSRASHAGDRQLLARFAGEPLPEAVVVLVRHAKAGKRSTWRGPDALRPLEPEGHAQAAELARVLPVFGPERIFSADRVRCIQTIQPMAELTGHQVEIAAPFDDDTYLQGPARTLRCLEKLAGTYASTVVCSQGVTIPGIIEDLGFADARSGTRKAAWWVVSFSAGGAVSADYYADPRDPH
jgi:8-oxo-dGTP pyrophosphatase MutT (NUDIX family)/phosphohistidine phosphatase SixA